MRCSFLLVLGLYVFFSATAFAVELTSLDVGTAEQLPGETVFEGDQITVSAAGNDIWGNADGFRFIYLELSGDFDASAQIPFFNRGVDEWSKAGIMGRDTLDADSPNVLSTADESLSFGAQVSWRSTKAGSTSEWNLWENGGPQGFEDGDWIRLQREGDTFTGYYHADGEEDWLDMQPIDVQMDEPIYVGLAVTSHNAAVLTTATFAGFTVQNASVNFPGGKAVDPQSKLSVAWATLKQ